MPKGLLPSVVTTLDMSGIGLWCWLEEFKGESPATGRRACIAALGTLNVGVQADQAH